MELDAAHIDTKVRSKDLDFDAWLERNLDIIKGLLMYGKDFYFDVVAGNVPGHTPVNIVAYDAAIGTTLATAGANTGGLLAYSTTDAIDSISSTNAADVHQIYITGLDSNYQPVAGQYVTLNGQNRVAIPVPLFRIREVINLTATPTLGSLWVYENTALSGGKPIDLTKIRASVSRDPISGISFEHHTPSSFTVPAGKEAFIAFGKTTVSDTKALSLTFWARPAGQVWKMLHPIEIKNTNYDYFFKLPGWVDEKTDLEVRAYVDVGTAKLSAAYDLVLRDKQL